MESTRKPAEPQSGAGSVWQGRDASDEIESEMRDKMKQDSPTSQVADSNGDGVSVNKYISAPPSNHTGDHKEAGDAAHVETDLGVQLGKEQNEEKSKWKTPADVTSDDRLEERAIAEGVVIDHPSFKRPPFTRTGSSFTRPTKASLGWQTTKSQSDTNGQPLWKYVGSSRSESARSLPSRPGSAHSSSASRSNDYLEKLQRERGRHSPQYKSPKRYPIVLHDQLLQNKALENTAAIAKEKDEIASVGDNLLTAIPEDIIEAAATATDDLSELQHSVSTWADQHHSSLDREVRNMESDLGHFCTAWTKACVAAEISCEALAAFQSLVTKSEVDEASRSAAHQELEINKLANWISEARERIKCLERQCKAKDDMLEVFQAEIVSAQIISAEYSAPQLQSRQRYKAQWKQRNPSEEMTASENTELQLERAELSSEGYSTNTTESPSPVASSSSANPQPTNLNHVFPFPTSPPQVPFHLAPPPPRRHHPPSHPAPRNSVPDSILALREKLRLEREEQAAINALKDKVRRLKIESIVLPPSVKARLKERERERRKERSMYGEELTWFVRWRGDEDAVWGRLSEEEKQRVGKLG